MTLFSRRISIDADTSLDVVAFEHGHAYLTVAQIDDRMGFGMTLGKIDDLIHVLKEARRAVRHAQWKAKPAHQQEMDSTIERLRASKAEHETQALIEATPDAWVSTSDYRLLHRFNGAVKGLQRKWVNAAGDEDWRPVLGWKQSRTREELRRPEKQAGRGAPPMYDGMDETGAPGPEERRPSPHHSFQASDRSGVCAVCGCSPTFHPYSIGQRAAGAEPVQDDPNSELMTGRGKIG